MILHKLSTNCSKFLNVTMRIFLAIILLVTCYSTSSSSSQSWIRFHNNNIVVDDGTTSSILLNASNSKVRDKDRGLAAVRGLAFAGSNVKSKLLRCSDARINIYDPHSVQSCAPKMSPNNVLHNVLHTRYITRYIHPRRSTRLNSFLGADGGILGVGAPELATIVLIGYFVLGPQELYKLTKEIGEIMQERSGEITERRMRESLPNAVANAQHQPLPQHPSIARRR